MEDFYLGSAFGADGVDDSAEDDILFGNDPDFDREQDIRDIEAGDYGAVKRRRARRKAKRSKLVETILMPFARTPVAAGTAGVLTVEPDRDCRLLDLRVTGSILATGVEDPGISITGLTVGGANLFNAAGAFTAVQCHPRDRRVFNCKVRRIIRQSTQISLAVANLTAGAISVDATLLVRCRIA